MSKRAKELAKQLYPDPKLEDYDDILVYRADRDNAIMGRSNVICVYEQAERDTIERAIEWLKVHAKDYIVNMTGSYPDAPFDAIIGEECWDELKKEMENNG